MNAGSVTTQQPSGLTSPDYTLYYTFTRGSRTPMCNSCHVMSWSARASVRLSAQWASIGRTSSRHTHTHSDGMGPR